MVKDLEFTEDHLLGGSVILRQPAHGYRVAIDPIFLAAAIQAQDGDTVIDIGAGVGAASLCLAKRLAGIKVIGLEIQREYVRLASQNIKANDMAGRVEILCGDLMRPPPRLAAGTFSHIMTNPPYLEHDKSRPSPNEAKQVANTENQVDLESWAKFCLLMAKPKGTITFIHRADRLDHILAYFAGKLGSIQIYPLWPGNGKAAKRVIVSGIKGSGGCLKMLPGMNLHEADGRYTSQADAVLRAGQEIVMV